MKIASGGNCGPLPRLTPRLCQLARLVPPGDTVADIGTDHAYLPVWLVKQGICPRAFACDIGTGPLQSAARTVAQYGVADRITLLQSDGLATVPPQYDTLVIAGMGGDLIARILSEHPPKDRVRLLLQPMTAQEDLRRFLYEHSYRILREEVVREGEKLYTVILAKKGSRLCFTELDCHVAKTLSMNENGRLYLNLLIAKLDKQIRGLRCAVSDRSCEIAPLETLKQQIEERMYDCDKRL